MEILFMTMVLLSKIHLVKDYNFQKLDNIMN